MAGHKVTVLDVRQRMMDRVLEFLRSKSNGSATLPEIRGFLRAMSMSGIMAEAVIDWLEQARRVRYERDLGAVYLLPPGATATRPLQPRDDEAIGG